MAKSGNILKHLFQREAGYQTNYLIEHNLEHIFAARDVQEMVFEMPPSTRSVFCLAISPDGDMIASTNGDHNVYIHSPETGKLMHAFVGHRRTPWCISFHPTIHGLLASGCLEGEVRVWCIKGQTYNWLADETVSSLEFHPTERLLLVASGNKVYFWDWHTRLPNSFIATKAPFEKVRFIKLINTDSKLRLITGICNIRQDYDCENIKLSEDERGASGESRSQISPQNLSQSRHSQQVSLAAPSENETNDQEFGDTQVEQRERLDNSHSNGGNQCIRACFSNTYAGNNIYPSNNTTRIDRPSTSSGAFHTEDLTTQSAYENTSGSLNTVQTTNDRHNLTNLLNMTESTSDSLNVYSTISSSRMSFNLERYLRSPMIPSQNLQIVQRPQSDGSSRRNSNFSLLLGPLRRPHQPFWAVTEGTYSFIRQTSSRTRNRPIQVPNANNLLRTAVPQHSIVNTPISLRSTMDIPVRAGSRLNSFQRTSIRVLYAEQRLHYRNVTNMSQQDRQRLINNPNLASTSRNMLPLPSVHVPNPLRSTADFSVPGSSRMDSFPSTSSVPYPTNSRFQTSVNLNQETSKQGIRSGKRKMDNEEKGNVFSKRSKSAKEIPIGKQSSENYYSRNVSRRPQTQFSVWFFNSLMNQLQNHQEMRLSSTILFERGLILYRFCLLLDNQEFRLFVNATISLSFNNIVQFLLPLLLQEPISLYTLTSRNSSLFASIILPFVLTGQIASQTEESVTQESIVASSCTSLDNNGYASDSLQFDNSRAHFRLNEERADQSASNLRSSTVLEPRMDSSGLETEEIDLFDSSSTDSSLSMSSDDSEDIPTGLFVRAPTPIPRMLESPDQPSALPLRSVPTRPAQHLYFTERSFLHPGQRPLVNRIQCWDYDGVNTQIDDAFQNIVVPRCHILNESSVDISKDCQKLVALVPTEKNDRAVKVEIFSITPENLGKQLCVCLPVVNAVSVSFSSLANFVVVGRAWPRNLHEDREPCIMLIRVDEEVQNQTTKNVAMPFKRYDAVFYDVERWLKINVARWIPSHGICYATNTGSIVLCKPSADDAIKQKSRDNTY